MKNYTAGPWSVHPEYPDDVIDDRGQLVANAYSIDKSDETQANARLIAAAPELLSALRIARPYLTRGGGVFPSLDLDVVDEAIAKAEGK